MVTGFISFADYTGLFFGRFSKPVAFFEIFLDNAVIAPYKDITGLR
jgi:inward rectifier potassium channel